MQSIETKTLAATAHRGERVRATHSGGVETITNPFNYGWDWKENHANAARQLMRKLGWTGEMHGGTTRSGMAWVTVNTDKVWADRISNYEQQQQTKGKQ